MNQLDQLEAESPVTKLGTLGETFVSSTTWPDGIRHAQTHIRAAAEFGRENELNDVTSLLRTVDELIDVLLMTYTDSEAQTTVAAMSQFCKAAIDATSDELNGKDVDPSTIPNLLAIADERWSDYLSNPTSSDAYDAWACDSNAVEIAAEVECPEPHQTCDLNDGDSQQIGLILGALGGLDQIVKESVASLPAASAPSPPPATGQTATEPPSEPSPFGTTDNSEPLSAPAPVTIDIDQETVNAFADDAVQCVSVIETEVLRYEQDPNSLDALRQICRELHTIKGASAAIGLSDLAGFLHRVEDSLEQSCQAATQTDVEVVLQSVDAVRSQLEVLVAATSNQPTSGGEATANSSPAVFDGSATPDSIRVNAGQLDRLFDMLAELVMLRNRRDSNVGHLKRVNAELLHCVSRLRSLAEHVPSQAAFDGDDDVGPIPISSLTEIASDMLELGRTLRQTIDPITEENITLSRFIDQFRSEVIELRRLPVQSLFTRLQRPIRDAAKTEGKKVQVRFVNEHVGLERSLHEKLYEPLMHVVRNAVSHGIELPEDRLAADKPEEGTITIEAHSGSNLFVIEVRDNGKGLDYDVVRKLAIERGLVSADEQLTQEEIANLIFRPGFSTRDVVSEVSGRGVGMDVVAGSVEELHGWVELESKKGEGTCIRLLVPRSSFIESTLVFRLGEQYFAFPTRFVVPFASDSPNETGIQIRKLLAPQANPPTAQVPVRIESPDQPNREAITVWVDEVVGTD